MVRTIIISAVNLDKGGTGTILRECLSYLSTLNGYKVIAIVHKKEVAEYDNIEYIELPWAKKRWINRLWCEYVYMYFLSKKMRPIYLWFSLHDTTPNVIAEKQAVYCHNPFPFYNCSLRELFLNYKIFFFSHFSDYIYRYNQKRNTKIVVQQDWIRKQFVDKYKLNKNDIIVSPPSSIPELTLGGIDIENNSYRFMYPASANSHKNFECLLNAARLLENKIGLKKFVLYITINGCENRYAKWLRKKWGDVESIDFLGFIDRKKLYEYYDNINCLVFPSKLETWGLPITEFAPTKKPMLLANCIYTHETASGCSNVALFDPNNPQELANLMELMISGDYRELKTMPEIKITKPIAKDWVSLFELLLK